MAEKEKKKKIRNVTCPECETECVMTVTDEGNFEGNCDNCGLDVGVIYTKRRYRDADRKIDEQQQAESGDKKKKQGTVGMDW